MLQLNRIASVIAAMTLLTGCSADVGFTPGNVIKANNTTTNIPNSPTINEQYIVPKSPVKVDVLFVVDGTPRMFQTITKLQTRMQGFLDALGGADYQAGIMNSSMGSWDAQAKVFPIADLMPLNPYPTEIDGDLKTVTSGIRNSNWILGRNLSFNGLSMISNQNTGDQRAIDTQPYGAVGASMPLNAIKTFMQAKKSSGFFRAGAMFVPIIISAGDENDEATPLAKAADVQAAFASSLGQTAGGMRAFSVIVKPNDTSCLAQYSSIFSMGSGGVYGKELANFASATGGASISLCGSDYTSGLAPITSGFSSGIKTITLKYPPIEGSLKIVAVPAADLHYTNDGTTVTFAQPLPAGSTLSISYQVNVE